MRLCRRRALAGIGWGVAVACVPSLAWPVPADSVVLGDQPGAVQSVQGPASVLVALNECSFSVALAKGQYLRFNTPDVVFVQSATALNEQAMPHLWQAETYSGYEWQFRKPGGLADTWFGVMCEGTASFSLLKPEVAVPEAEVSPGLQVIRGSNDLKCPATLTRDGWVPTQRAGRPEDYVFEQLSGPDWSGFVLGYRNTTGKTFGRISFCLIHDDQVLLGAAENDVRPLKLSAQAFEDIKKALLAIRFQGAAAARNEP